MRNNVKKNYFNKFCKNKLSAVSHKLLTIRGNLLFQFLFDLYLITNSQLPIQFQFLPRFCHFFMIFAQSHKK